MKILAISGSGRTGSTNTAMLQAVAAIARDNHQITVFAELGRLPVFTPDLEGGPLPQEVQRFVDLIRTNQAIIVSSPEYVRALPGGLKNAIDWLVSREEIIDKPIALMHASHRGDDMLTQLRLVLSTVSQRFTADVFLRFALMTLSPEAVALRLSQPANRAVIQDFLEQLSRHAGDEA